MNQKQESLLRRFEAATHAAAPVKPPFAPAPEYRGGGTGKRIRRLVKYRGAYLSHLTHRMKGAVREFISPPAAADAPARTFWGRELLLPGNDSNARTIRATGTLDRSEDSLIRYLIRELKEADVFYDIGANYGFYSALAQELGVSRIHAFEPSPHIFPYLEQLQDSYPDTVLNNTAVSDSTEPLSFFDCYDDGSSGKSTVVAEVAREHRGKVASIRVPAVTLDSYADSHPAPTFIKMDVEGAEDSVLRGAKDVLDRSSPRIAIELWSGPELHAYSHAVIDLLDEAGYRPYQIRESGELEAVQTSYLRTWVKDEQRETNFVYCKNTIA